MFPSLLRVFVYFVVASPSVTPSAQEDRTLSANRVSMTTTALVLAKYETSRILRLDDPSGDSADDPWHAHSLQFRARDTARALAEGSPDSARDTSCAPAKARHRIHNRAEDSPGDGGERTGCAGRVRAIARLSRRRT